MYKPGTKKKKRMADKPKIWTPGNTQYLNQLSKGVGYPTYKEYLQSDHWKSIRLELNRRWPDICCLTCGDRNYQVHHITYEWIGYEKLSDLIPLCPHCHQLYHDLYRIVGKTKAKVYYILMLITHDVLRTEILYHKYLQVIQDAPIDKPNQ